MSASVIIEAGWLERIVGEAFDAGWTMGEAGHINENGRRHTIRQLTLKALGVKETPDE